MEYESNSCKMVSEKIILNASDIERELSWFKRVLQIRSALNSNQEIEYKNVFEITPPHFNGSLSGYAKFIK